MALVYFACKIFNVFLVVKSYGSSSFYDVFGAHFNAEVYLSSFVFITSVVVTIVEIFAPRFLDPYFVIVGGSAP